MCTPGVPLTPSNIMRIVREIEEWWGDFALAGLLHIPKSKQEEIRQKFADDMEQKKQSIFYCINTDPLASWRKLITVLDNLRQTHLADSIRPNAEPLTGSHQLSHCMVSYNCMQMTSLLNMLTPMCMCIVT